MSWRPHENTDFGLDPNRTICRTHPRTDRIPALLGNPLEFELNLKYRLAWAENLVEFKWL